VITNYYHISRSKLACRQEGLSTIRGFPGASIPTTCAPSRGTRSAGGFTCFGSSRSLAGSKLRRHARLGGGIRRSSSSFPLKMFISNLSPAPRMPRGAWKTVENVAGVEAFFSGVTRILPDVPRIPGGNGGGFLGAGVVGPGRGPQGTLGQGRDVRAGVLLRPQPAIGLVGIHENDRIHAGPLMHQPRQGKRKSGMVISPRFGPQDSKSRTTTVRNFPSSEYPMLLRKLFSWDSIPIPGAEVITAPDDLRILVSLLGAGLIARIRVQPDGSAMNDRRRFLHRKLVHRRQILVIPREIRKGGAAGNQGSAPGDEDRDKDFGGHVGLC